MEEEEEGKEDHEEEEEEVVCLPKLSVVLENDHCCHPSLFSPSCPPSPSYSSTLVPPD